MFLPKIILYTCVSFLSITLIFSEKQNEDVEIKSPTEKSLTEMEEYLYSLELDDIEPQDDAPEPAKDYLDIEKRKMIVTKYLDELESVKKDWIDPFDMGGLTLNKIIEQAEKEKVVREQAPKPSLTKPNVQTVVKDNLLTDIKDDLTTIAKDKAPTINKLDSQTTNNKVDSPPVTTEKKCISVREIVTEPEKQQNCVLDNVYITRWLKKLLLRIEKGSDLEYSTISFALDSNTLENIKEMSNAKSFDINTFDDILSNLLAQAIITRKETYAEAASSYYKSILWAASYVLCITVFVYALHRSFVRQPRLTVLCCVMAITVFWHWMHLYQQKKAHHHAELSSMQIPTQCKKHDLGLLEHMQEYVKSFFTTTECRKYYEALLVDPLWEVSLTVAATEAVTATLFQPLFASSRAINAFIKQLFDGLPFFLSVVLVIFIFFFTIMKMGYKVNLPFWLGRIEPCYPVAGSRVEEVGNAPRIPTLVETVLNAVSDSETVQASLEETTKRRISFVKAAKDSLSKPIEYVPNDNSEETCTNKETSKELGRTGMEKETSEELSCTGMDKDTLKELSCTGIEKETLKDCTETDPESSSSDEMISEEGLALRSGYFEVVKEDSDFRAIEYPAMETKRQHSETKDDSNTLDSKVSEVPKSLQTLAYSQTVAKYNLEVPKEPVEPSSPVDDVAKQEVSNLPEGLSDSFEVIPRSDETNAESMSGSRIAGPNCDTSQDDLLSQMHRGCKYCN